MDERKPQEASLRTPGLAGEGLFVEKSAHEATNLLQRHKDRLMKDRLPAMQQVHELSKALETGVREEPAQIAEEGVLEIAEEYDEAMHGPLCRDFGTPAHGLGHIEKGIACIYGRQCFHGADVI